jgi:hypothetical protein
VPFQYFVQDEKGNLRRDTGTSCIKGRKSALQETLYDPPPDFCEEAVGKSAFRLSGAKSEEVFYEL